MSKLYEADLNSIWIRDYGANTVYGSWNDDQNLGRLVVQPSPT